MEDSAQRDLLTATVAGDADGVRAAVAAGADLDAPGDHGHPPIVAAAHHGRLASVEALIALGADLHARVQGRHDTALHRAARYGRFAKRDGRDLTEEERRDYLPMVQALLAAGANLEAESEGNTPLGLALQFASAAVVEALLEAGGDPNRPGWRRLTPLELALEGRRDRLEKLDLLLKAGADPSVGAPLAMAANVGVDETAMALCARLLAGGAPVDQASDSGWTALTHAVTNEHLPLVELLLAHGARADLPIAFDEHQADLPPGITAAGIASRWELTDILQALERAAQGATV